MSFPPRFIKPVSPPPPIKTIIKGAACQSAIGGRGNRCYNPALVSLGVMA